MFDVNAVRQEFPILDQVVNGKPMVYLDSGASSQKPTTVIDSMNQYYREYNANVHRGIYQISEKASEAYEGARKKVGRFINANSWREVVFTRNATEAMNLVAFSWGDANIKEGDVILSTEMEHHANIVPWQQLAARKGATVKYIPVTDQGYLDMAAFDSLLTPDVKLVAVVHMSNVLGTINPVEEIIEKAHNVGALVLLDGAQSVPHMPTDVQALDCDFLAFSGHKMLAPTGIGVLWAKKALLSAMPPFMTGGDMIKKVSLDGSDWNEIPWKFEAGTPAIAETIGLGYAVDYLNSLGMENIRQHEIELTAYALEKLNQVEGIRIFGPQDPEKRGGAIAFTLGDVHPHDVAGILDREGIAVRAGHHCAMPLHDKFELTGTTRASFYVYNVPEDADRLAAGLEKVQELLGL
ncbi:MAG: cysteine desulfurase [Chloroflexota bacterium]